MQAGLSGCVPECNNSECRSGPAISAAAVAGILTRLLPRVSHIFAIRSNRLADNCDWKLWHRWGSHEESFQIKSKESSPNRRVQMETTIGWGHLGEGKVLVTQIEPPPPSLSFSPA